MHAHPRCNLQCLDTDDLEQTMSDALSGGEQRLQAPADELSFRLQTQFMQAHGVPRGEVTTLTAGGLFVSGKQRR